MILNLCSVLTKQSVYRGWTKLTCHGDLINYLVFLFLSAVIQAGQFWSNCHSSPTLIPWNMFSVENNSSTRLVSSFTLLMNQLEAMFLKKGLSIIRSWILLVIQIAIPVIFLIIAMVVVRTQKRIGNLPPMPLELSKYNNPVVLIDGSENAKDYSELYQKVSGDACKEVESIRNTILRLVITIYFVVLCRLH